MNENKIIYFQTHTHSSICSLWFYTEVWAPRVPTEDRTRVRWISPTRTWALWNKNIQIWLCTIYPLQKFCPSLYWLNPRTTVEGETCWVDINVKRERENVRRPTPALYLERIQISIFLYDYVSLSFWETPQMSSKTLIQRTLSSSSSSSKKITKTVFFHVFFIFWFSVIFLQIFWLILGFEFLGIRCWEIKFC